MAAKLSEAEATKKAEARAAFIKAAWDPKSSTRDLLTLAKSAGIETAAADKMIAEIKAARADVDIADKGRQRKCEATIARNAFAVLKAKNEAEIKRLEGEIEGAAGLADAAREAMFESEHATKRLFALYQRGLVPPQRLTASVHNMRAETAKKAKLCELDQKRHNAREFVKKLESKLFNIPFAKYDSATAKKETTRLNEELAAAKATLTAAEAVFEKAKGKQ